MKGFFFLALATISSSSYLIFSRLAGAAAGNYSALAVMILNMTSFLMAFTVFLAGGNKQPEDFISFRAIVFAVLLGASAFGIDFFQMRMYGKGADLSFGAPVIVAGGIILTTIFALAVLREEITFLRIAGLALTVGGCAILVSSEL